MKVFWRLVADRRRGLIWWTIGILFLVLSNDAFYPTVKGFKGLEDLAKKNPAMKAFLGDAAISITSPAGYLQGRHFSLLLPVVLVVFAVGLGSRAIGGSEEDGSLELMLANPVSRERVVAERALGFVGLTATLGFVNLIAMFAFSPPFGLLKDISIAGLLAACGAATAIALMHGSIAFAIGAVTGKRGLGLAVAAGIGVAGYVINGIASASSSAGILRFFTPWHWYLGRNMLAQGIAWESLWAPLGITAVLIAVGCILFPRRDLT